ncbi:MAG: DUF4340 domain-containing protein [Scytolyngbya sp. HA4215-MV1]|jgi:hypothetical protein|nr:DUF4340 domain-containing protein [Scytolyngbya sp. HA4215-MV1]
MKIQRTPLILLLIAALLSSFVYFHEIRGKSQQNAASPTPGETVAGEKVFAFKEEDVQSVTVTRPDQTLAFERSTPEQVKKQGTPWQMKAPTANPASDASVAYLLNLLASGRSDRTLTVPATQQTEFGLDKPLATIEVKLKNQQTHRLILGKPNFSQQFLYAQADPPPKVGKEISVLLVSKDFANAVKRPLAEWQQASEKSPEKKDQPSSGLKNEPTPEQTSGK